MNNMGISNIFIGGFNSLQFSVMGMLVVFIGLLVICLYIIALPKLLDFIHKLRSKTKIKQTKVKSTIQESQKMTTVVEKDDENILVAIATAMHLYQMSIDDNQRITTWENYDGSISNWKSHGLIQALSQRKSN